MRFLFLSVFTLFINVFPAIAQKSLYFTSTPALTPDSRQVIFSYNGNLWRSATEGGFASPMTTLQGISNYPRVSPDGKWIAFSNSQMGNSDVYVMPSEGGQIRRLTFHSANDIVESWSWDNNWIYFTSNRYDRGSTYKVNVKGGTPIRVFSKDYFDYTHNAFEDPVTGEIFFDDSWESSNFYNRIGYKGAFNPEVQSYNLKTGTYKKYTNWIGKDMSVSVDKNGKIYFISDEANGKYNLYTFEGNKKVQLTNFNTSVFRPFVNANGTDIVFEKDFQLYIYNIASKKSTLVPLKAYQINTLEAPASFSVAKNISNISVSPDGKKLAFVSRGKLLVSDAKGKFVKELNTMPEERVSEVYWLKDNETILFTQTNKGFNNLYTIKANSEDGQRQITDESRNDRSISFNKKKSQAVYLSGNNEVRMLDLKTMKSSLLVTDEIWGLNSSTPYFSPDDQYVMYNAIRNFETDILLVRLKDKKIINITNTGVSEGDPLWSPDGKSVYFVSNRTEPSYPYGLREADIYKMSLEKSEKPFRSDFYDSLFTQKPKDTSSAGKKKETPKLLSDSTVPVKIDFKNIMERLERVGPVSGRKFILDIFEEGDKTRLLFLSNHENEKVGLWQITLQPFEKDKTEKIKDIDGFVTGISGDKSNLFVLSSSDIYKLNLSANSAEKINVNYTFGKNLKDEFNQMFYQAWAVLDENYYAEDFNKVDWPKIRDHYASFLQYVETRDDIRTLLNNMMGELNTSHYGFSSTGKEEATFYKSTTASPGIMFKKEAPFTVDFVIPYDAADVSSNRVLPGDLLVAVDGKKVDPTQNREFYFMQTTLPEEMTLTFKRGDKEETVKIHPSTYSQSASRLYEHWENINRQKVNALSNNKIGYVYMRDMTGPSLEKFRLDMVSDSVSKKDALIFDLRYNTGGNVHDEVLQFLSRKPYLKWKYRNGQLSPQPNFAPSGKPIILLMNEQTLSDGEMTSAGFKQLGLGKIVGTETYRWIIFTSGTSLVDGSFVRLPSWGCYTLDGKDLEKTGVTPDIFVKNTFKDRMEGNDPQIEKAVEEILKELK